MSLVWLGVGYSIDSSVFCDDAPTPLSRYFFSAASLPPTRYMDTMGVVNKAMVAKSQR